MVFLIKNGNYWRRRFRKNKNSKKEVILGTLDNSNTPTSTRIMIVIKHWFFFVISMMALPAANLRSDSKRAVMLPMARSATVADVVESTHNGHTGFNIPLCPQFTKRAFWQSTPWSLHEYPAMHTDKLTTAAMIRFITQSPQLFKNSIKETAYKNALNAAITAHKTWLSNKTEENAAKLHQAEDVVMAYLQTLRLSNSATRKAIEAILSTPTHWLPRRALGSFFLPFRSSLVFRKIDGKDQQNVSISGTFMTSVKSLMANTIATIAATRAINTSMPWDSRKRTPLCILRDAVHKHIPLPATTIKPYTHLVPRQTPLSEEELIAATNEECFEDEREARFNETINFEKITLNPGSTVPATAETTAHALARLIASYLPNENRGVNIKNGNLIFIGDNAFDLARYNRKIFLTFFMTLNIVSWYAWMNDHKLTPEPAGGIKVTINLS